MKDVLRLAVKTGPGVIQGVDQGQVVVGFTRIYNFGNSDKFDDQIRDE